MEEWRRAMKSGFADLFISIDDLLVIRNIDIPV